VPRWAAAAAMLLVGLAAGSAASVLAVWIPVRRGQPASQVSRPQSDPPPSDPPRSDPPRSDPPRSDGPRDDLTLHAADLIPLTGWLRLRGRYPARRVAFGLGYPAAELITAALFVALWFRFGASPVLPAFCYLALVGVALGVIDARYKRLPDVLTLPSYPVALVLLGIGALFVPDGGRHFAGGLIGLAVAWLFFALQAFIYPAGIGWGDVKLSGVLGLYLGWFGTRAFLAGLLGSYLLAFVAGIGLLLARRATRKSLLPFGPFMLASCLAVIIATGPGIS
jgi:prepilin signal peptidase PulO-like enzyme (type II secretory pathway)